MNRAIARIVIVGGGTSGWLSAAYLQQSFPGVDILVIESPSVKRMGVGEATIPNFHNLVWECLGISEETWMRRVNATPKLGIKFINWRQSPTADPDDYYYHLFGTLENCDDVPLSHYWAHRKLVEGIDERFDYTCFKEPALADAGRSPRDAEGRRIANYAWHFDANLVADYLKEISLDRGVRHLSQHVDGATTTDSGMIAAVHTRDGATIPGDLFIDCTGFRAVLIEQALGERFVDMSDTLLCDSAVATQLPLDNDTHGLRPYTTATALSSGWCWDIPLLGRFGGGYVFSRTFQSEDRAIREFAARLGVDPERQPWNTIRFPVGRRQRSWVNNCVAIGLASSFLEPLESTALYLTYGALYHLVRFFPDKDFDPALADRFNEEIRHGYDDCHGFVQMHYITTQRDDTAFWAANRHDLRVCDVFHETLRLYKAGRPINQVKVSSEEYYNDFELEYRNFWTDGSYYSVLTGMGIYPEQIHPDVLRRPQSRETAERMLAELRADAAALAANLPSNHDYIKRLHR